MMWWPAVVRRGRQAGCNEHETHWEWEASRTFKHLTAVTQHAPFVLKINGSASSCDKLSDKTLRIAGAEYREDDFPLPYVKPHRCSGAGCKPHAVKSHRALNVETPVDSRDYLSVATLLAQKWWNSFHRLWSQPAERRIIICISDMEGVGEQTMGVLLLYRTYVRVHVQIGVCPHMQIYVLRIYVLKTFV